MRTVLLVEVWSAKPIAEITDVLAGRMWTHDQVQDVSARLVAPGEVVSG